MEQRLHNLEKKPINVSVYSHWGVWRSLSDEKALLLKEINFRKAGHPPLHSEAGLARQVCFQ